MKTDHITTAVLIAIGLSVGTNALASVTFNASGSGDRAASVTFNVVSGNLQVTLVNSGTEPSSWDSTYMLGGVFFDYNGPGSLSANDTATGAVLPSGSGIIGTLSSGQTIGSYWAYGSGISGPGGASQGLSAVGYGIGLPSIANMGPAPQALVDGAAGGLLGWDNLTGANSSIKKPVAYTTIMFTLVGNSLPNSLSSSMFSNVNFQYGTSTNDPDLVVPETGTVLAGALLLLPLGASMLRILRKNRMA